MTINICIIFLIIIGIILLIQSPIKKIYKENFTVASGGLPTGKGTPPGTGGDDIDEMNIPTITTNKEEKAKIENGYEIVGSIPPPSFRDEIYDHNLRDALQVWKDAGCKVTSKYAPNVDNKDNLFGKSGWADESYKTKVKSMYIEANKPEYNYYDWGHYKDKSGGQVEGKTNNGANEWEFDTDKMDGEVRNINRPKMVTDPMGIRKSYALCYDDDKGGYILPKMGDRIKIKQNNNYDGLFFSGLVSSKVENGAGEMQVFWEQKGSSTYDGEKNRLEHDDYTNVPCNGKNLNSDEVKGCIRNKIKNEPAEIYINNKDRANENEIARFLHGQHGNSGQKNWFGWPQFTDSEANTGDPAWNGRYLKGVEKYVPTKLKSWGNDSSIITEETGLVDRKKVFITEKCTDNSTCEDLRCGTRIDQLKKDYPLTHVCDKDARNTFRIITDNEAMDNPGTQGLICKSGVNKGKIYTYYNKKNLCADQDYGENASAKLKYPRNFCDDNCGNNPLENCISYNSSDKNTYLNTSNGESQPYLYITSQSEENRGYREYILGSDNTKNISELLHGEINNTNTNIDIGYVKMHAGTNIWDTCVIIESSVDLPDPFNTLDEARAAGWTREEFNNDKFKDNNFRFFTDKGALKEYINTNKVNLIANNATIRIVKKIKKTLESKFNENSNYDHKKNVLNSTNFESVDVIPHIELSYIEINGLRGGDQNIDDWTKFQLQVVYDDGSKQIMVPMSGDLNPAKNQKGSSQTEPRPKTNQSTESKIYYGKGDWGKNLKNLEGTVTAADFWKNEKSDDFRNKISHVKCHELQEDAWEDEQEEGKDNAVWGWLVGAIDYAFTKDWAAEADKRAGQISKIREAGEKSTAFNEWKEEKGAKKIADAQSWIKDNIPSDNMRIFKIPNQNKKVLKINILSKKGPNSNRLFYKGFDSIKLYSN